MNDNELLELCEPDEPTAEASYECTEREYQLMCAARTAIPRLIADNATLRKRLEEAKGQLLHANSHDCTAWSNGPHGEELSWEALTEDDRAWWIGQASLPPSESEKP